jgi:hypothetical protein
VYYEEGKQPLTKYFDEEERQKISSLYSALSGDMLLFSNYDGSKAVSDFFVSGVGRWFYCCPPNYYYKTTLKSDHGNINLRDRQIPFIICGKAVEAGVVDEADQVDMAPTVAEILGFDMTGADGESIVEVDETTGRIKIKSE